MSSNSYKTVYYPLIPKQNRNIYISNITYTFIMARPRIYEHRVQRNVILENADFEYLQSHSLGLTAFVRQAIITHKKGEWR